MALQCCHMGGGINCGLFFQFRPNLNCISVRHYSCSCMISLNTLHTVSMQLVEQEDDRLQSVLALPAYCGVTMGKLSLQLNKVW